MQAGGGAVNLLHLSGPATQQGSRQFFILIKGLPGSGKSTLAASLARALCCPLVDKDDARDCFQPLTASAPQLDWNGLSYDVMFRCAERQLGLGLSVVADCPFARPELYQRACGLAGKVAEQYEGRAPRGSNGVAGGQTVVAAAAGVVTVVLVDVQCGDEAQWRQRLEARGVQDAGTERAHKPSSWLELQALLRSYNGSWRWSLDGGVEVPYHVRVCTSAASTEECVRDVLSYLETLKSAGAGDLTL